MGAGRPACPPTYPTSSRCIACRARWWEGADRKEDGARWEGAGLLRQRARGGGGAPRRERSGRKDLQGWLRGRGRSLGRGALGGEGDLGGRVSRWGSQRRWGAEEEGFGQAGTLPTYLPAFPVACARDLGRSRASPWLGNARAPGPGKPTTHGHQRVLFLDKRKGRG